jgi:hypothetical protein
MDDKSIKYIDSDQENNKAIYCGRCKTHCIVNVDYINCLSCFRSDYVRPSEYKVVQLECEEKIDTDTKFWCMKCGNPVEKKLKRYFGGLFHYCFNDNELTKLTLREPHYEAYTRSINFTLQYFPYTLQRLCKIVINKHNIKTPWPKHSSINNTI